MAINHAFRLASRPVGLPSRENWEFTEEPVGEPGEDEVLVRVLYISLDPAMRGWMNDSRSYIPPVAVGEVMRALALGRVEESRHPDFAVDDYVTGPLGAQEYATLHGAGLTKIDPTVAPLPVHLSALGMPGLTAYFGLLDVGHPEAGETVAVSGAAGAVGHLVGQIAKLKGARVVGIAGGPAKCTTDGVKGPSNYLSLLVQHASMTGFVVSDYFERAEEGRQALAEWLAGGELHSREDLVDGLESFPEAFIRLFTGEHNGKLMIRVAAE